MHGQDQRIAFRAKGETQVGAFGNDALVTHQPLEAFGQGAAGHQRVTHHMERSRAHHPRHVQANRFVARELDRELPEAGHGVLRKTCIRIVECGEIQPQLLEHRRAIEPFELQRLHNP